MILLFISYYFVLIAHYTANIKDNYKVQSQLGKALTMDIFMKVTVLLLTIPSNLATSDLENIVKDLMKEMKMMKEDLHETKKVLVTSTTELQTTKFAFQELKRDMKRINEDLLGKDVVIQELKRDINALKEPPWTFFCGAHPDIIGNKAQAITYQEDLLIASSNVEGASLDTKTGLFTSGFPGSYTITWSLLASNNHNDSAVSIYLRKNGNRIQETWHYSWFDGDSLASGIVFDQGSRSVVLHLDRGDTLDLYCTDCSAEIDTIMFCVSLSQFDVE